MESQLRMKKEGQTYIEERHITDLFRSFMVSLLHHRPDDPIDFLLTCVNHLTARGLEARDICWDTFLTTRKPSLQSLDCGNTRETNQPTEMLPQDPSLDTGQALPLLGIAVGDEDDDDDDDDDSHLEPLRRLGPRAVDIVRGDWSELPALPSNIVRIFLSSTFSDFKAERNTLPRDAFPKLQEYCSEHGLDFQVVDMRWGVTDEVANDHQVSALCLEEIIRCQQISCGPNFVVFLGNRYGFQPFPASICQGEFDMCLRIAEELQLSDRHILTEWFLLDENTLPPEYILQPIVQKLPHYNDTNPDKAEEKKEAMRVWEGIRVTLRTLLRESVKVGHQRGLIEAKNLDKYFMSVTEEEIDQGLRAGGSLADSVFCVVRELEGLPDQLGKPWTARYIDQEDGQLEQHSQTRLTQLIHDRIAGQVPQDNVCRYRVPWMGEALEVSNKEEYHTYLQKFSQDFVDRMKRLIETRISNVDAIESERLQQLYYEVIHHAKFAKQKVVVFHGRTEELAKLRCYVERGKKAVQCPFVVSGRSGFGKTALMASTAIQISSWLGEEAIVIARFCGTSPQSSSIVKVLQSVIQQIGLLFNFQLPRSRFLQSFTDVRRTFWRYLDRLGKRSSPRKLVIILDSIDQLLDTHGAHSMIWLPRRLPVNVSIILSMISDRFDCLRQTKLRIPHPDKYIELEPLSSDCAAEILDTFMSHCSRQVTQSQRDCILQAFSSCKQPLFLKLMMDNAKTWHSYTPVEDFHLSVSVNGAIVELFSSLEARLGDVFVQHALGYLTCSKGGISSVEMEDVLSCDDEVLNHVYRYHDPPVKGVIRIPSLMWSRLQHSLKEYLVERQIDGKTVYTWYHRQFWEAAEERFLSTESDRIPLHSTMADLFLQEAGICRTIVLHQRFDKVLEDADRGVTHQPLTSKNLRKLGAMTYHLLHANRLSELKQHCLLNLDWLLIKLIASDSFVLFQEFEMAYEARKELKHDPEMTLMQDFLSLCMDALWTDPFRLPYQVVDRLFAFKEYSELLTKLHTDARDWLDRTTQPVLIPVCPMRFQKPGTPLQMSALAGSTGLLTSDQNIVVALQTINTNTKINVFNLATRDILATVGLHKATSFALTHDDRLFVYCEQQFLHVCEVGSGDQLCNIRYEEQRYSKSTIRCLCISQNDTLVAIGVKHGKPVVVKDKLKRNEIKIYVVNIKRKKSKSVELPFKKPLDKVCFFHSDTKLFVSSCNRICIFEPNTMEQLSSHCLTTNLFHETVSLLPDTAYFVGAVQKHLAINLLFYDHENDEVSYSEPLNDTANETPQPLGLVASDDGQKFLAGYFTGEPKEIPQTAVSIWNRTENTRVNIQLSPHGFKPASSFCVLQNWIHAFVGWMDGLIDMLNIEKGQVIKVIRPHGQAITRILSLTDNSSLLTFSMDNTLSVWRIEALIKSSKDNEDDTVIPRNSIGGVGNDINQENTQTISDQCAVRGATAQDGVKDGCSDGVEITESKPGHQSGRHVGSSERNSELPAFENAPGDQFQDSSTDVQESEDQMNAGEQVPKDAGSNGAAAPNPKMLNQSVQTLDFTFADDLLLTSAPNCRHGLKVWNLEDGAFCPSLTDDFQNVYESSYDEAGISFDSISTHGSVERIGQNLFVYQRKQRKCRSVCVFENCTAPSIRAHAHYNDSFVELIATIPDHLHGHPDKDVTLFFMVRDTTLDVFTLPDMALDRSIAISKMSDDISNFDSNAGKKKLLFFRMAITYDGKYLIMTNPATLLEGGTKKALDVVDLERGEFVGRFMKTKQFPFEILQDRFYYLLWDNDGQPQVYDAYHLAKYESKHEGESPYKCLIYTGKFVSDDRSLGIEIDNRELTVRLWQLNPLKRLHKFTGHLLEIRGADISSDNSHVATCALDKTVRVYSVSTGQLQCSFHVDGVMSCAKFNPSGSHLVVHCYTGVRQKRVVILRFHRQNERRQLQRRVTTKDLWE